MKRRPEPRQQRGIALITAMLVVALAVIAATAVLASGNIAIQRMGALQETEKAQWYAYGVEAWVGSILERDARINNFDALSDIWAQPVDYLPIDQGFLRGQIVDMQGRFNINNLGVTNQTLYPICEAQFVRLLQQFEGLDASVGKQLAGAIRDWIDPDQEPGPSDGAEDTEYLSADPPYRAGNQYLQSVGELLAVKGMTRDIYRQIAPFLAALPLANPAKPTTINLNTAPEIVLRSLVARPTNEMAEFVRDREKKPAETLDALFGERPIFGAQQPGDVTRDMVDISSQYFQLRAEATIGKGRVAIYSLYFRPQSGTPVLVSHSSDGE